MLSSEHWRHEADRACESFLFLSLITNGDHCAGSRILEVAEP